MKKFQPDLASYLRSDLSSQWLREAYKMNWFKLFIPNRFQGAGMELIEALEQLTNAASVHGSLGWCANLGSGAGYFYRFFDRETAENLFTPVNAVIAGSGKLNSKAQKVDGGYIVSGIWDKCSGAAHATLFTVSAPIENENVKSFVLLPDQVRVENGWNMFALKATSSYTISAQEVFVPDNLAFDIGVCRFEDTYPISKMSFEIFSRLSLLSGLFGVARCFLYHVSTEFSHRGVSFAEELLHFSEYINQTVDETKNLSSEYWDILLSGKESATELDEKIRHHAGESGHSIYRRTTELFYKTGMSLADENTLSHHAMRDVMLACQHYMLR